MVRADFGTNPQEWAAVLTGGIAYLGNRPANTTGNYGWNDLTEGPFGDSFPENACQIGIQIPSPNVVLIQVLTTNGEVQETRCAPCQDQWVQLASPWPANV
ncbi:hypothetical protein [Streptomyces sp. NPDC002889]|uniref:hypothetical protein n=1 Tax=Streptomyces sp. NPDC002889 TaxID=3364669 RepID=UPI0036CDA4F0